MYQQDLKESLVIDQAETPVEKVKALKNDSLHTSSQTCGLLSQGACFRPEHI